MDDIQKPQPTEPIMQQPVGMQPTPAPAAPPAATNYNTAPTVPLGASSEPRNFLATFLLASYGGLLGLRHFYLGQKTLGFVRLGLFLAYFLLLILGGIAGSGVLILLGGLSLIVAYIWTIVDFFVVYLSVKNDADGQPLTKTNRDAKWAKVIFMVTVILSIIAFVGGVLFAMMGENLLKKAVDDSTKSNNTLRLDQDTNMNDFNSEFNFDTNSSYDF